MHRRLRLKIWLLVPLSVAGCASEPIRPLGWWRGRAARSHVAQSSSASSEGAESNFPSLSAAPAKLPAGIELPPEPSRVSETQPSGATQPDTSPTVSSVIFAGFR
jgi:hypothetical protein